MRRVLTTIVLLCSVINCISQTPKNANNPDETKKHEQTATSLPNQAAPVHNQPSSAENDTAIRQHQEEIKLQRQLAKFTGWLVAVGFLQVIVLGVQTILFFQQKRIMGQHKTSLEELATAANTSAGEAVTSTKFTRETIKDSERAEVLLASAKKDSNSGVDFDGWLELKIKNFGRTRATDVSGYFKFTDVPLLVDSQVAVLNITLGAGQEHVLIFKRFKNLINGSAWAAILREERILRFVGELTYGDIFGEKYTTHCSGVFNSGSVDFTIEKNATSKN